MDCADERNKVVVKFDDDCPTRRRFAAIDAVCANDQFPPLELLKMYLGSKRSRLGIEVQEMALFFNVMAEDCI